MTVGKPKPLLIAHRGASKRAPENTMEAFQTAADSGAHALELDVRLTSDKEVVVIHDATVDRTTNGRGTVFSHTYRELHSLDAGFNFMRKGFPVYRGRGVYVPRLQDVLTAFPRLGFNIEIKQHTPPMVEHVLDLLYRIGPGNVILAARHPSIMQMLEAARPDCVLGLSYKQTKQALLRSLWDDFPSLYQGRALQIPIRHPAWALGLLPIPSATLIKKSHKAKAVVHVWTVNSAPQALRFLKMGVDGLFSDDPAALKSIWEQASSKPQKTPGTSHASN